MALVLHCMSIAASRVPQVKKGYVGIHSSGFKDFLLKPELLRAIQDCGFEHPSEGAPTVCLARERQEAWGMRRCHRSCCMAQVERGMPRPDQRCSAHQACPPAPRVPCRHIAVQHECIPQAILGMDVICQAKSGMGKTAVFVISTLQQLEPVDGQVCERGQTTSGQGGAMQPLKQAGTCFHDTGLAVQLAGPVLLHGHGCTLGTGGFVADGALLWDTTSLAQVSVVVLCHTRELAFQICHEYER